MLWEVLVNYKKPAFWIIVAAVAACAVVTVCFATNPVTADPVTAENYAKRPTLQIDGAAYVDPYMPVSILPYGYLSAGRLTEEQANNTGLEGVEYFVNPSHTKDFYTYQECGTPIDLNTVDSTQRQWAYVRWIPVGNDDVGRKLTLDDVLMLSQKKDALTWSDFELYSGQEIGFGLYIMQYEIDELFEVLVGGVGSAPNDKPMYIYLTVNNEAEDFIDIRTEDVSGFIEAHRNDSPTDKNYHDLSSDGALEVSVDVIGKENLILNQSLRTNSEEIKITNNSAVKAVIYLLYADNNSDKPIRQLSCDSTDTITFTGLDSRFRYQIGVSADTSTRLNLTITE